jgi:site-specific DNA recombinase
MDTETAIITGMKSTPKVFGYARVSSPGQVTEGVSLAAQEAKLRERGAVEVFVDEGISGQRTANRPGLTAALDAACESRGATFVVYSLSRLARSTSDALAIAKRLEKAGVALVSLSESIDTGSAMGRCFFTVLAAIAQLEADIAGERTRMGLAFLKASGKRYTARIPFGYSLHGDKLVPDPAEQKAIKLVRRLRANGESLQAIADALRARGVKTKSGSTVWSRSTVDAILRRSDAAA